MEANILKNIECRVCHQIKPLTEFPKDKASKIGYRNECKQCKQKRSKALQKKWEKERLERKDIPQEKKCNDCHQIKPISEFTKDKNSKDGLSHYCKYCKAKRHQNLVLKWKEERSKRKEITHEKKCSRCQRILPVIRFGSNIRSKDGLSGMCKECHNKQSKEYKERWKKDRLQNPINLTQKKCPSCQRLLNKSEFYEMYSYKDGLSFYCKECELKHQKKHKKKWEKERNTNLIKIPKEKKCIICHRILLANKFYKNRSSKDGLNSVCIQCDSNRQKEYMIRWKEELSKNRISLKEKKCAMCKRILPISMFYKNKRHKTGLSSSCIECINQRSRDYIVKWDKQRAEKETIDTFTLFPSFEKICNTCNRMLPKSQFYKKSRSKDGLSSNCIECDLKLVKEMRIKRKSKKIKQEIPEEKFCKKCQRMLPSSEFHRLWSTGDGLAMHCKECKSEIYKDYLKKPGVKKRLSDYKKEYRTRPGIKEHERKRARKYSKRPYVKEKRKTYLKEYYSRPEVKLRRKKYLKEYYNRPEVKERVKLYYQEYQNKKKLRDIS